MRTPRSIAALLLLLGIIIGTLADQRPILSARRAGDYVVLEGDFHVRGNIKTVVRARYQKS